MPRLDLNPLNSQWKRIVQLSLKLFAIGFTVYSTAYSFYKMSKTYGDTAPRPPLYGIYDVKSFKEDGKETIPLATDERRWKRMIISFPGNVRITTMPDSNQWMKLKVDVKSKTAEFTSSEDSTDTYKLKFYRPDKIRLFMKGKIKNKLVKIEFKRFDESQFRLVKTGFHWINEYPNNR